MTVRVGDAHPPRPSVEHSRRPSMPCSVLQWFSYFGVLFGNSWIFGTYLNFLPGLCLCSFHRILREGHWGHWIPKVCHLVSPWCLLGCRRFQQTSVVTVRLTSSPVVVRRLASSPVAPNRRPMLRMVKECSRMAGFNLAAAGGLRPGKKTRHPPSAERP